MENCNQLLTSSNQENLLDPTSTHFANLQNLGAAGAISTTFLKGFGLAPQTPIKPRKRKKMEATQEHISGAHIIRSGDDRKDRHSKVCTARGTRDRRVRLSPKTAIGFYDVQDRLGYDRPSKAIDWLMNEAKAAIAALDEPPPLPAAYIAETHQTRPVNTGSIHSHNNFDTLTNNLLPAEFQFSSSAPSVENFDSAFEMASMQRGFTWNYGNTPAPLQFPASSHGQIIREPLQSSYSRSTNYYNPFTNISNKELQHFSIVEEENEIDTFMHYEH